MGTTTDVDPFNNSKWDYVIDLGERGTGPFSAEVSGLSQPNVYYFRLCSEFRWSFLTANGGNFQFQAPTPTNPTVWSLGSPSIRTGTTLLSATEQFEMDDWTKTGTAVNCFLPTKPCQVPLVGHCGMLTVPLPMVEDCQPLQRHA